LPKSPRQSNPYIEECQEHHQEFFALANAFCGAVKAGEMPPVTQSALDALAEYAKFHFAKEEEFMEKTHYAGAKEHQARHRSLVNRVNEFHETIKSGGVVDLASVTCFINEMTRHDHEEDGPFFEHLAARGASAS